MIEKMSVQEAADEIGVTPEFIRNALKQQRLPIGCAVQGDGGRWSYLIIRQRFNDYFLKGDRQ